MAQASRSRGHCATTSATRSRRFDGGAASACSSARVASSGSGASTVSGGPCGLKLIGWSLALVTLRPGAAWAGTGTIPVVSDTEPQATSPHPRPTRLVLVRHAVTPQTGPLLSGRKPGIDLSDEGRRQAEATAERLAPPVRVDAIYASPIERTQQTAAAIAARHDLPVVTLEGVIEAEYGDWTGGTIAELAKTDLWKVVQAAPSRARFPNGESIAEMQARMVAALDGVIAAHPGEHVVVVSHADPIKAAIAHYKIGRAHV